MYGTSKRCWLEGVLVCKYCMACVCVACVSSILKRGVDGRFGVKGKSLPIKSYMKPILVQEVVNYKYCLYLCCNEKINHDYE